MLDTESDTLAVSENKTLCDIWAMLEQGNLSKSWLTSYQGEGRDT